MVQNFGLAPMGPLSTYEDNEGQLTFSSISTDTSNMVVQANTLIKGRQDLSLNEAKLVRIIIMQIMSNDLEFAPYELSPGEFAMLVGNTDATNMYHKADEICTNLMKKQLEIVSDDGSWEKYNWVSKCKYNNRTKKLQIKLNDDLKPLLIGLAQRGFYTQYTLDNTLQMDSVYALRIFELIQEAIKTKILPINGIHIQLEKQTIIDACMLYKMDGKGNLILGDDKKPIEKYSSVSMMRKRVIKIACDEISAKTSFYVPYESDDPTKCVQVVKKGRDVIGFDFYVNSAYHEPGYKDKMMSETSE